MYYSEVTKIIEAGIDGEKTKIIKFAQLLAKKLNENGDERASNSILNAINRRTNSIPSNDGLVATPVDQESRLSIVNISYETEIDFELILSDIVMLKLKDFVDTIKTRDKMTEYGLDISMSLLLYGPPGCGKTSVAHYLAGQLGLPLVTARLDSLVSSLLGSTSKNIRKIFQFAQNQPCVLFLDEFDAIAKARDDKNEMGELKRVVNSLLQNIDDYCKDSILIAATNHQQLLDTAIWRRFHSVIEIPKPREQEIKSLLGTLLIKKPCDFLNNSKKMQKICNLLLGCSHSDIKNIIQSMIKKSIINEKDVIEYSDCIVEIYLFLNHGDSTPENMMSFMCLHGVAQSLTARYFNVSVRQVRNALLKEGNQ